MAKIVVLFKDKNTGKWEKAIAKDKDEKEIIMALHVDESAFVKRYCLIGRGVKTPFDTEEEASASKEEGDVVQVMAPPNYFSEQSEDVEFFYSDNGEEQDNEDIDKLPIAEEDMLTDITEQDATPLGDGEDIPEK
jgi:hypothetical protein